MKFLRALAILALAIAVTVPVCAETQSIKLSGDLAVRYIGRDDYDFNSQNGDTLDTDGNYFMTNAEVQLDADLTDNVGVTIRMVNQHDWDVSQISGLGANNHIDSDPNAAVGAGGLDGVQDSYGEFDVLVDLAYVTLKEFFFTPLTVRIGKQDLWFGKGFIVGANYEDPNGQISADEFTSFTSFKAIRATWDMEPWTIDGVFAMIEENEVQADDDEQLYGVNLACDLSEYKNAEAELYYWYDKDDEIPNMYSRKGNRIHCFGTRGSYDPHEDITMFGEVAIQRGQYIANAVQQMSRERSAWAADIGLESRLWEEQYAWRPVIGAEYIFYSGQNNHQTTGNGQDWGEWNRMFRGKTDSAIHEWRNVFYTNGVGQGDRGDTNQHQFIVTGKIQPMDNLTIDSRFIKFLAHENDIVYGSFGPGAITTSGQDEKDIGNEVDVELTYEYTEDVTFGLLTAWFWAGDYYAVPENVSNSDSLQAGGNYDNPKTCASEIVASCKVTF